jgi:8-oxo-dGTP pyrophosphatase MutT (NUDIX family)
VRSQVVLLHGNLILMARHQNATGTYWVLPGGSIETGETPEFAAIREIFEETSLRVRVRELLFVEEPGRSDQIVITQPRYTFLGDIVEGTAHFHSDGEEAAGRHGYLAGVEWLPLDFEGFDGATRATLAKVKESVNL